MTSLVLADGVIRFRAELAVHVVRAAQVKPSAQLILGKLDIMSVRALLDGAWDGQVRPLG